MVSKSFSESELKFMEAQTTVTGERWLNSNGNSRGE